jgi:DNA helicase II / ATP-dependent DNA helicase PcrA
VVAVDALAGLDDHQRVVATTWGGPLCVLAGAGTGKTRALTHRIAYGIQEGHYQPDHVLALTFTAKAASEMGTRLQGLGVRGVAARTFHSAALRQLQHFWPTVAGGRLPDISGSKGRLVAQALESLHLGVDTAILRDIAADIEWRKVHGLTIEQYQTQRQGTPGDVPGGMSMEAMASIHERYERVKDEASRIDFEDVLLATVGLMEENSQVLEKVRAQYSALLVDEYQDVSPLQQRLLDLWIGPREDVVVVGDASQTIYTFAGASSHYLLDFPTRYPGARVVKLEKNYRSTPEIVDAANSVVRGKPGALTLDPVSASGEPLHRHVAADDAGEAQYVATVVAEKIGHGVAPDDIAVLMRFGAQSLAIENALRQKSISYRVRGATAFFEEPHIKRAVMEIRGAFVAGVSGNLVSVVEDILFGLGLGPEAPDHHGAERSRYEDLAALRDLARAQAPNVTLAGFSEELAERSAAGDAPTLGALTLTTVHSAKGREWPVVFMIGLAEGQFPISYARSEEQIEEERRLFYVGITRAQRELYLSFAERSKEGSSQRQVSRFLEALGRP